MKPIAILSVLVLPVLAAFAGCADSEQAKPGVEDASASVPPPDAGPLDGAAEDASVPPPSCADHPWCPVPTGVSSLFLLEDVWGSAPDDVWAVGSGGTVVHWNGSTWLPISTTPKIASTFRAVWGSGPDDAWAVAMTNEVFHYTGATAGWNRTNAPAGDQNARAAYALWGISATDVRVGARAYSFFDPNTGEFPSFDQYMLGSDPDDGGVMWTGVPGTGSVLGMWGSSATDIWVVVDDSERVGGAKGVTRHGAPDSKGDLVWKDVDSQSSVALEGVWGSGASDVWAVGGTGAIRHMRDGAARWEIIASPTTNDLHAVWGSGASDVWAVGDGGTILHFDGTSWVVSSAAFANGTHPDLYGVWGSAKNDVWIVGDAIALHYTGGAL